jgi:hypothetical protein
MSKDTIKNVKRQFIDWEKVVVNHVSDKILVPKVCGAK